MVVVARGEKKTHTHTTLDIDNINDGQPKQNGKHIIYIRFITLYDNSENCAHFVDFIERD